MASSKSRQRALARAKVERQIARRAATARRRRQWQAGIGGALALALVVFGAIWLAGGFKPDVKTPADCAWTADPVAANPDLKDVGTPPTRGVAKSGSKSMTITTNQGPIAAVLDPARAPCTVASMAYLAGKKFFDGGKCHSLGIAAPFALRCGDPSGTGKGGPAYHFSTEYTPPAQPVPTPAGSEPPKAEVIPKVIYSRGVLAMANSDPTSNGSQFYIFYKDSELTPNFTVFGAVTSGLEIIDKIAAAGLAGSAGAGATDGPPKTETAVQSVTVGDTAPVPASPAPASPAPASPAPASPAPGAAARNAHLVNEESSA